MRIPTRIFVLIAGGALLVALAVLTGRLHLSYAQEPDTPVEPAAQTPGPEPTPPDRPTPGPNPTDPPPEPTDPPPDPTAPPPDPTDPPPDPTDPPPDPTDPPPDPTDPPPAPTSPGGGGGDDDDDDDRELDLTINKQVSSGEVSVGQQIEYVLTITHAEGDGIAGDVVIEDTLPASVELIGATTSWGELSTSGNTVRVEIDRLFPGDVVTVRIQARVLSAPTSANNRNSASVSTVSDEITLDNNRDSVVISGGGEESSPTPTPTAPADATPPADMMPTASVEALPTPADTDPETPPATLPETGTGGGMLLLLAAGFVAVAAGFGVAFMRRRRT